MTKECQKCRDYKDCPGRGWFHYGEIRFCPYQIIWIIENAETLRIGNWPDNPDISTYTDPMIKSGYRDEAYYAKPCEILGEVGCRMIEIIGEVECRLNKTSVWGRLLITEVVEMGRTFNELSADARSVVMYLKGWRRKRTSFVQWKASRNYYKSITKRRT